MKHKHYDMIVAKAANMELVQFVKFGDEWIVQGCHENAGIAFEENYQYFLCLPQHKESCLHWLNGGEVEMQSDDIWMPIGLYSNRPKWDRSSVLMQDYTELRIKPRKEKRWIAIRKTDLFVEDCLFCSKEQAVGQGYPDSHWQFHEIEIEI